MQISEIDTIKLTQDTRRESNKYTIKHQTQESQEVRPFPADDHSVTMNRQEKWQTWNTNSKIDPQKSTALEWSVKTSLLEGSN